MEQQRRHHLVCLSCTRHFLETHGTPFHGKQVEPEKLVWAMVALAEGLGLRAVARVFAVDPNTVLSWLVEAAEHLKAFSHSFLHDVHVEQVQMDELFALLSAVKMGKSPKPKRSSACRARPTGCGWRWTRSASSS